MERIDWNEFLFPRITHLSRCIGRLLIGGEIPQGGAENMLAELQRRHEDR